MTDFVVKETGRGAYGVYSAFNDALLAVRDTRDEALDNARERAWRDQQDGGDATVKLVEEYGPKEPEAY